MLSQNFIGLDWAKFPKSIVSVKHYAPCHDNFGYGTVGLTQYCATDHAYMCSDRQHSISEKITAWLMVYSLYLGVGISAACTQAFLEYW